MVEKSAAHKREATKVLFLLVDISLAKVRKMLSVNTYVCFFVMGVLILLSCWTSLDMQARNQRMRHTHRAATTTHLAGSMASSIVRRLDVDAVEEEDLCYGRRIFMYDLPPEFNSELVDKCRYGVTDWLNFCPHAQNGGLGLPYRSGSSPFRRSRRGSKDVSASSGAASSLDSILGSDTEQGLGEGWYKSDPYMLEVAFHSRMLKYSCLTTDSSRADAFYLPYYTGVDSLRYLYNTTVQKYSHGEALAEWIDQHASREWKRFQGKDHFLVLARTSWDFYLLGNGTHTQWGTGLFQMVPHMKNLTALIMERKPWMRHEQAIPYLTSFHPSASELQTWLARVRSSQRSSLFSFAGASRSNIPQSIRNYLLDECSSSVNCTLVDCAVLKCSHDPEPIIKAFLHSSFCLQPRGDTPTRRSAFDSMIAGCIPVFFHKDSAYTQYTWHLPGDPSSYSVFISEQAIRDGLSVEGVLASFSPAQVTQMRETVISVIPKLVYARENGEFDDAFETTVQNVLERISRFKRRLLFNF